MEKSKDLYIYLSIALFVAGLCLFVLFFKWDNKSLSQEANNNISEKDDNVYVDENGIEYENCIVDMKNKTVLNIFDDYCTNNGYFDKYVVNNIKINQKEYTLTYDINPSVVYYIVDSNNNRIDLYKYDVGDMTADYNKLAGVYVRNNLLYLYETGNHDGGFKVNAYDLDNINIYQKKANEIIGDYEDEIVGKTIKEFVDSPCIVGYNIFYTRIDDKIDSRANNQIIRVDVNGNFTQSSYYEKINSITDDGYALVLNNNAYYIVDLMDIFKEYKVFDANSENNDYFLIMDGSKLIVGHNGEYDYISDYTFDLESKKVEKLY